MSNSTTRALAILRVGPMQSWGSSSRFTRRKMEVFPTKSALVGPRASNLDLYGGVGLLAAAASIDKHGPDEAEKLAPGPVARVNIPLKGERLPTRVGMARICPRSIRAPRTLPQRLNDGGDVLLAMAGSDATFKRLQRGGGCLHVD